MKDEVIHHTPGLFQWPHFDKIISSFKPLKVNRNKYYEMLDSAGNLNLVSVTTWANQETYEHAEKSLKEYYKSIHFNPMTYRERLKITAEHGVYSIHDY